MDVINIILFKIHGFIGVSPRAFHHPPELLWMLLNLCLKSRVFMCEFMDFWGHTSGYPSPSNAWIFMEASQPFNFRVFHPRENLTLLATLTTRFQFQNLNALYFMQPGDSVGQWPNVTKSTSQSPRMVIEHYHALTPKSCDVPVHMQCNVMYHYIWIHTSFKLQFNTTHILHAILSFMTTYLHQVCSSIHKCYNKKST